MESKIMNVYYDTNNLPFKDINRSVHFPIIGSAFNGANNTTQIRFFVDQIGGTDDVSWVVITKLPNGKILYQLLSSDNIGLLDNEHFIAFDLSSQYTQLKGDIYISLNGYQGSVEVEEDEETGIYSINGTPTIQATGCIKLSINYAPQLPNGNTFGFSDYQNIAEAISNKVSKGNAIIVLDDIFYADISGYKIGQYFYDIKTKQYYQKSENGYELVEDNSGLLGKKYVDDRTDFIFDTVEQIADFFVAGNTLVTNSSQVYECTITMNGSVSDNTLSLVTSYIFYKKSECDDKYVPYTGATKNVNLGTHTLKAKKIEIEDEYHIIDLVGDDIFIGNGLGNIVLSAEGYVYCGEYKVATEYDIDTLNTNKVPYNGANRNVNLGTYSITCGGATINGNASANNLNLYQRTSGTDRSINFVGYSGGTPCQITFTSDSKIQLKDNAQSYKVYQNDQYEEIATQNYANAFAKSLSASIDTSTYVMTLTLKDYNNNTLSTQTIDLPLETMVVGGSYDDDTESIILTLKNGQTISIPVGDLVSGLVSTSDLTSTLASYYTKTQTDTLLSAKVPTSRTISGLALSSDISSQALTDSLVFMNNTTDLDYVMGD